MQRFIWQGGVMTPQHKEAAVKAFEPGRSYWLEEVSERSWISHEHQFAWIRAAWDNLPEALARQFPSPEHLRKAALIATGWCDETILNAANPKAARTFAAYVRDVDAFAYVRLSGSTVVVRRARSQRRRGPGAMSKADFQASKDAILGWIATLIGVEPYELRGAA